MNSLRLALLAPVLVLLAACGTTYKPLNLDAKTGMYDTTTQVAPGAVSVSKTKVTPSEFAAVLVVTSSNRYPTRLEFLVRHALLDMGYHNVVNITEFREWARDSSFALSSAPLTPATVKAFSSRVSPVLIVDMRFSHVGGTTHQASLRVTDGRSLEPLLQVNHVKTLWASADEEILYPVLNELRKWQQKMGREPV